MTDYPQRVWLGSGFLTISLELVKLITSDFMFLKKFYLNHIFGIGEARQFKFHVLIDTQEY